MRTLVSLALIAASLLCGADTPPPNFIIVLADDQGYGDLGCYGSPYIRTPNIDRMAREGIRFTDFYAQPFCGPSRAALLTGCYPPRNSLMFNHLPRARTGIHSDGEVTLAELLAGPRLRHCTILGKWHLGDAPAVPSDAPRVRLLSRPSLLQRHVAVPSRRCSAPPTTLTVKTAVRKRAEYTPDTRARARFTSLDWFPATCHSSAIDEVIELNPDQSQAHRSLHR